MRAIRRPAVPPGRAAGSALAAILLLAPVPPAHAAAQITAPPSAAQLAAQVAAPPSAARADPTATAAEAAGRATAAASRARAKVDAQLERYQVASAEVNVGVRALSAAFAAASAAEVDDAAAAARQRRAQAAQAAQIRAVYEAGGVAGLTGSVLGATSPDDALWRASTADRILGTVLVRARDEVVTQADRAALARRRAAKAAAATDAQAAALAGLERKAAVAAGALTRARATLSDLDTRARRAEAALESARQIAAAQASARAARRAAMGTVTALGIPAEYQQAYQAAALTCPGMNWTLLAAVGQVETGHGRNNRPSSAGAIGPMQFMPRTFAAFAVDGDDDGIRDAWDPQDAIFTAAHYLCASGARDGSAAGIHAALLAYNHAEWYVDLVLAAEQAIIARAAGLP